jgi:ribosomal protein S18 acetylase RimI-like enzyme
MIRVDAADTRADRRAFLDFPFHYYQGHPYWVPPLRIAERRRFDRRTNPFLSHADVTQLLARDAGTVRGRIAFIDDHRHNQVRGENLASFGFLEAESEPVARALLDAAERQARARRRAHLRGPLNFSLNDAAGLLVDGFNEPPALLMPYNPPEYATYLANAGYAKVKDLYAWTIDLSRPFDRGIIELAERVKSRHAVRVTSPTSRALMQTLPTLVDIYGKAWEGNWGFVPPTPAEATRFAEDLKWIANPDLVLLAQVNGVFAACAVAVPDVNQLLSGTRGRLGLRLIGRLLFGRRGTDRARLLLLGVLPQFRRMGLYPLLIAELAQRAIDAGIRHAEFSWVLEDNADINQVAVRIGAVKAKTYRLFEKSLE